MRNTGPAAAHHLKTAPGPADALLLCEIAPINRSLAALGRRAGTTGMLSSWAGAAPYCTVQPSPSPRPVVVAALSGDTTHLPTHAVLSHRALCLMKWCPCLMAGSTSP